MSDTRNFDDEFTREAVVDSGGSGFFGGCMTPLTGVARAVAPASRLGGQFEGFTFKDRSHMDT